MVVYRRSRMRQIKVPNRAHRHGQPPCLRRCRRPAKESEIAASEARRGENEQNATLPRRYDTSTRSRDAYLYKRWKYRMSVISCIDFNARLIGEKAMKTAQLRCLRVVRGGRGVCDVLSGVAHHWGPDCIVNFEFCCRCARVGRRG